MDEGAFKKFILNLGFQTDLSEAGDRRLLAGRLLVEAQGKVQPGTYEEIIESLKFLVAQDLSDRGVSDCLIEALSVQFRPAPDCLNWLADQCEALARRYRSRELGDVGARAQHLFDQVLVHLIPQEDDPAQRAHLALRQGRLHLADTTNQEAFLESIWQSYRHCPSEAGYTGSVLMAKLAPTLRQLALELRDTDPASARVAPEDLLRSGILGLQMALDSLHHLDWPEVEQQAQELASQALLLRARRQDLQP